MALRSQTFPSQDSLDQQLRGERRRGCLISILLFIFGIALGGILGYFGFFDPLGKIIENLLLRWAEL